MYQQLLEMLLGKSQSAQPLSKVPRMKREHLRLPGLRSSTGGADHSVRVAGEILTSPPPETSTLCLKKGANNERANNFKSENNDRQTCY